MPRKLASIQKVKNIRPIQGADSIEVCNVLGWQVVVRKGDFEEGDWCVYCEVDSILPEKPEFEFLKARGYRVKTIRLKGQISQGICFPIIILPNVDGIEEGLDVTELLGVSQYIPKIPTCLLGKMKGAFPHFLPKTDETRVQLLQNVLTRYKGTKCYVTEKVDGSSTTFYIKAGEFGVCSRNVELCDTEGNDIWRLAKELKLEEKLRNTGKNIAVQGEIVGNGIQGNSLKLVDKKILFFNVFLIDEFKYLDFEDFKKFFEELGLETVPVLETDYELEDNIDNLVKKSVDKSVINPKSWREGIVIRPLKEVVDLEMSNIGVSSSGRLSFKVINPEYLIENE